jgi:hypothetical protein
MAHDITQITINTPISNIEMDGTARLYLTDVS